MGIPNWLPVVISSLSVCLAFSAFFWQVRGARFNQSVDLLFRLEGDFFGPAKKLQRAKAATDLLAGRFLEVEPILDFFETMALLQRRGALDPELVKHTFFYWIDNYYEASRQIIEQRQSFNPLTWKDLSSFVQTLRAVHAKQIGKQEYRTPTPDEIHNFLTEELTEAALLSA